MRRIAAWLVIGSALLVACAGGGGGGEQTCRNVLDCPSGELCLNGVCKPSGGGGGGDDVQPGAACDGDHACPSGQECRDTACVLVDGGGGGGDCSCAADDPCTATTAACGGCARTGTECTAAGDCDDQQTCTVDACVCGFCEYETSSDEGCCVTSAECDDGVECTVDTCVYNRCEHEGPPGCCSDDGDCNDGDPCTTDGCRDGACVHESVGTGCCTADAECDDGDWCTLDACVVGRCVNPRSVGDPRCGCGNATMCEDANPCTRDLCEDRVCLYEPVSASPGGAVSCCRDVSDCDDGDDDTNDECVFRNCRHLPARPCADDAACAGAYVCFESRCAAGACRPAGTRIEDCCESDVECDDEDTCTKDSCGADQRCRNAFELQPGCCRNDANCDDGLACTAEFCCQSDLCTGTTGSVTRNHCTYTIRPGSEECCSNDLQCEDGLPCTFDVCVDGSCYAVDTGETCCASDPDCDDGNPCTEDSCHDGSCTNRPIPDCCIGAGDCDDDNPCTEDACEPGGTCSHARLPECCTSSAECNDHDVCTQDLCDEGSRTCDHPRLSPCCQVSADCVSDDICRTGVCNAAKDCVYEMVAGCCHTTADCDDGDACTLDECSVSQCHHRPSDTPECCDATITWSNGFPFGAVSVDGWTFNPPFAGFGWQVVNPGSANKTVSPPYALYYGNADTHTFFRGFANLGSAQTPDIRLPDQPRLFFNGWVWMEMSGDPTARFTIRVARAPTYTDVTPVWTHSAFAGNTGGGYRFVSADLSAWRGSTIRIEFYFATDSTSSAPGPEGVFVDDLAVGYGCVQSPVECQTDVDCVDADPCTTEACVSQSCDVLTGPGPTCCEPRLYSATFDNGRLQGLSTGVLPGATATYGWAPSDRRAKTLPYSLYFGDADMPCGPDRPGETCPAYGNDDEPARAGGTAETGPIPLAGIGNPILSFELWTDIDPIAPVAADHLDVVVISQSTLQETVVWSSISEGLQNTNGRFQPVVVDLEPWSGQTVRLRFLFDTADGWGYGEGVYVDDVAVGEDCR